MFNLQQRRHFPRDDRVIVKNNNTIGGFYIHILNALGNLTNCGRNNSIFTGDPSRQVNVKHWSVHGHSLEVYDYFSAVEAIQLIMEQGEGSSPCNPVAWNEENEKSLSHYFLFHSVAERREIKVFNKTKNHILHMDGDDQLVLDYNEVCCACCALYKLAYFGVQTSIFGLFFCFRQSPNRTWSNDHMVRDWRISIHTVVLRRIRRIYPTRGLLVKLSF